MLAEVVDLKTKILLVCELVPSAYTLFWVVSILKSFVNRKAEPRWLPSIHYNYCTISSRLLVTIIRYLYLHDMLTADTGHKFAVHKKHLSYVAFRKHNYETVSLLPGCRVISSREKIFLKLVWWLDLLLFRINQFESEHS